MPTTELGAIVRSLREGASDNDHGSGSAPPFSLPPRACGINTRAPPSHGVSGGAAEFRPIVVPAPARDAAPAMSWYDTVVAPHELHIQRRPIVWIAIIAIVSVVAWWWWRNTYRRRRATNLTASGERDEATPARGSGGNTVHPVRARSNPDAGAEDAAYADNDEEGDRGDRSISDDDDDDEDGGNDKNYDDGDDDGGEGDDPPSQYRARTPSIARSRLNQADTYTTDSIALSDMARDIHPAVRHAEKEGGGVFNNSVSPDAFPIATPGARAPIAPSFAHSEAPTSITGLPFSKDDAFNAMREQQAA